MISESASAAFAELARRIHVSERAEDVFQAIVDIAVDVVTGCDHASVMIKGKDGFVTVAASDAVASAIDELELLLGEGPCLDAVITEDPQIAPDLAESSPWPALTAKTLAATPVRGSMGFRLLTDGRKAGALDLFSDRPNGFDERSVNEASVLASFASVALMTFSAREQAENLKKALESNREIGKAVGLLMSAHKVSKQRAFDLLDRTSQELNLKLADVASRVVRGQQSQHARPAPDNFPTNGVTQVTRREVQWRHRSNSAAATLTSRRTCGRLTRTVRN